MFKANESFEYPLWSDVNRELALHFGAASNAKQFFADRITVVLDPYGRWVLTYAPGGNLYLHPQDVLDDVGQLVPLMPNVR